MRRLALIAFVVVASGVFAWASSGGATSSTPAGAMAKKPNGKKLFKKNCASCHTLKAAGAKGTVGPNLDRLKPSKKLVIRRVRNGGGGMPAFKGRLTKKQINAIAAFVAKNT